VAPEGFVIACEPHPLHAASLRRLAALNPAHRLCVEEVAISDDEGTAELLAAEAEGWHSLLPEFNQFAPSPRTVMPVSTTTLDRITSDYGLSRVRGVVVKIDAEGAEADVLRAASSTLSLPNLKALILECTGGPSPFVERARFCVRVLLDLGFGVRVVAMSGQRDSCDADALRQVDLLALPRIPAAGPFTSDK
jgi:FkbM family methyltransferase